MENKKDNIYFYTMINENQGVKSSDICYGIDYDSEKNEFKTLFDYDELTFNIHGDIKHDEKSITFKTTDEKKVKLRYLNLPLYDSLKGYLLNYNYPIFNSDREVQEFFKKKKNNF